MQHPIPQEAFDWYDEYAHGFISRRTFLARLSTITTSSLTLGVLLPLLMPIGHCALAKHSLRPRSRPLPPLI
jgi:hypothetical protein